jgi:hypothetical protein
MFLTFLNPAWQKEETSRTGFESRYTEGAMKKAVKTSPTPAVPSDPRTSEPNGAQAPPTREMSLAKAKKLIRKTSELHEGLFHRLAK